MRCNPHNHHTLPTQKSPNSQSSPLSLNCSPSTQVTQTTSITNICWNPMKNSLKYSLTPGERNHTDFLIETLDLVLGLPTLCPLQGLHPSDHSVNQIIYFLAIRVPTSVEVSCYSSHRLKTRSRAASWVLMLKVCGPTEVLLDAVLTGKG
jgi:hypothetical protein